MKNLIDILNKSVSKINPRYDGTLENFKIIIHNSKNVWDLLNLSFNYGYIQGRKAAMAEARKKNK